MLRIIQEAKPNWVIAENVTGIINMELEQVCLDLEAEGYEVQPIIIPACAVNAPHRRDRVWIIANSKENASNTTGTGLEGEMRKIKQGNRGRFTTQDRRQSEYWNENWYEIAAEFCRVDARIPNRVDRLKSLGNSIVPQVVMEIMYAIKNLGNNYEED